MNSALVGVPPGTQPLTLDPPTLYHHFPSGIVDHSFTPLLDQVGALFMVSRRALQVGHLLVLARVTHTGGLQCAYMLIAGVGSSRPWRKAQMMLIEDIKLLSSMLRIAPLFTTFCVSHMVRTFCVLLFRFALLPSDVELVHSAIR